MVGRIFIARIYFTDNTGFKIRPVLLIKKYLNEDYLFLPITSNLNLQGIEIKNSDLESGNLIKSSVVIISKIGIILKTLLQKEIAKLKDYFLNFVMAAVCKDLDCK
jgi:mRNA interferase MazF